MIRAQTKRLVRSIYAMRCGYCGVPEGEVGAELTFDHFQPQSNNGSDKAENLVYACHACNEFKGDFWPEADAARLLHPLNDDLSLHTLLQDDGTLLPLTPEGEQFLRVLRLNRTPLVLRRQNERREGQIIHHYEAISRRLDEIAAKMQRIEDRIKRKRQA